MEILKLKDKKILIIAAHPDDEILGCGGTIIKLKKKNIIRIIFLTNGVSSRKNTNNRKAKLRKLECLNVIRKLGIKKPIFNNFPDNKLDSVPILKIIKNHYIQEETSMSKNFWKDLEEVYQNWAKTAWKHIKKILRVSQEANSYLDYQDAQTDLELQLNIQCINFNSQINKNDVELYYYYAKYLAQKKGK